MMTIPIEVEREDDGRWIGEVSDLPGVMAYGATRDEAAANARLLAMQVLTERIENGENVSELFL